jgi:hypothetical protein
VLRHADFLFVAGSADPEPATGAAAPHVAAPILATPVAAATGTRLAGPTTAAKTAHAAPQAALPYSHEPSGGPGQAATARHPHGGASSAADSAATLAPLAADTSLFQTQAALPSDATWLSAGLADENLAAATLLVAPDALAGANPPAASSFSTKALATTQPHQIDFTSSAQGVFGTDTSFSFSLPSFLYQHYDYSVGASFAGFGLSAGASITGGIKGSVALSLGQYTPDYPITIDPTTLPFVQDGDIFSIDPTLVSTDDATFALSLPQANANLDFGLQASAGVTLSFPSLKIGVTLPFVGFVGYTLSIPSQTIGTKVGSIFKLPSNTSIKIPGDGTITLSELQASTLTTTGTSAYGALPSLELSGNTAPFFAANTDLVALLAQEVPDPFAVLQGSKSFADGLASVGYNLLSLPLSGTLWLNEQVSLVPIGITETATDELTGKSESGTLGTTFDFTAPTSGNGTIPISITYSLTLAVDTVLYLDGSIELTLEGPSISASALGFGGSVGPLGNYNLLDMSGNLFELYSSSFTQVLTTTDVVDIQNFATSVTETISGKSGGVMDTKPASDVLVTATGTVTGGAFGIETGTLSTALVTDAGLITASGNGIFLQVGGTVDIDAGGRVIAKGNAPGDGVLVTTNPNDAVSNAGTISGFSQGVNLMAGSLKNAAGAVISATSVGVLIGGANATVTNDGSIHGSIGVELQHGGNVYNALAGTITASAYGVYAEGVLTLQNQCTLTAGGQGVRALYGGTITNLAGAYIHGGALGVALDGATDMLTNDLGAVISGSKVGVSMNGSNTVLTNDGTISGSLDAIALYGTVSNTLYLDPRAKTLGGVRMQSGATNTINLLAASGVTGTLTGLGTEVPIAGTINIADGASWYIGGNLANLSINNLTSADVLNDTAIAFAAGERVIAETPVGAPSYLSIREAGNASVVLGTIQATLGAFYGLQVTQASGQGIDISVNTSKTNLVSANNGEVAIGPNSNFGSAVTVSAGVTVSSSYYGAGALQSFGVVANGERATLTNLGTIIGSLAAINLSSGGVVINGTTGVISGGVGIDLGSNSIDMADTVGLTNSGKITTSGGGVYLSTKGTVTNEHGGVISSTGFNGVTFEGVGTLSNAGIVSGGRDGVNLLAGGFIYNTASGTLTGAGGGVRAIGAYGKVVNCGTIGSTSGAGIYLGDGGLVVNESGTIGGATIGVKIAGAAGNIANAAIIKGISLSNGGTIENTGTISANGSYAVSFAPSAGAAGPSAAYLHNKGTTGGVQVYGGDLIVNAGVIGGVGIVGEAAGGGTLTIGNTGTIKGAAYGISAAGAANITNAAGAGIAGGSVGVDLQAGGTLTNSGSISGASFGVLLGGTATLLIDSGSISGSVAIAMNGTASNTIILDPGDVLTGRVVATKGASNTITLAAGSTTGTLNGFGTSVLDFDAVTLASGAAWFINATTAQASVAKFTGANANDRLALSGGGALQKSFSGFGTLALGGSTAFTITAAQTPTVKSIILEAGSHLNGTAKLTSSLSGNGTLSAGTAETITLAGGFNFAGALAGPGTIVLASNGTLAKGAAITTGIQQQANLALGAGENLSLGKLLYDIATTAATQTLQITAATGDTLSNAGTLETTGPGQVKIAPTVTNTGTIESGGGTLTLLGTLTNSGTVSAAAGTLIVAQKALGAGTLDVGATSTLWLQAGAAATQAAHFLSTAGTLELSSPANFLGTIAGFGGSDVIDLASTAANTLTYANGILTVSEGSVAVAHLHIGGTYTTASFALGSDGHGGTAITFR